MWAVLGFVLAAAIGLVVVLAVGRRGLVQSNAYPWKLYATANMHVGNHRRPRRLRFHRGRACRDPRARPARHRGEFARYSHRDVLGGLPVGGSVTPS